MSALSRVAALSPFGPIFGKELRVTARRKRTYFIRIGYLLVLFGVLLAIWLASRENYRYRGTGVAARAQQQEMLGTIFYGCFVCFTTVAMGLIGPVLTATTISAERLGRTLNVLLMTPITAWQIISGKLLSRLLIALTLIGLSLPVLALSRLLGGVELWQMFGAVCLATTVALHTASIGLFFSTYLRRAFVVILLSYGTILFLELFVPFVGVAGLDIGKGRGGEILWANVNWGLAMASLIEPRMMSGRGGLIPNLEPWVNCCLIHLGLSVILVLCSASALRRNGRKEGGRPAAVDPSEYIPVASVAPPPPALSGDATPALPAPPLNDGSVVSYSTPKTKVHRAGTIREVSDNPVLWREVRRPLTARRWQAILFSIIAVSLLLISYAVMAANHDLDDDEVQIGYAIIFHGLLWLLVAVVSATSVAQEKESDTWTLLLATPIRAATIVYGKAAGLLRRMMWPFALITAHFALFTVTGVIKPQAFALIIWVMLTFNTVWISTGIYLSLRLRTVTSAVILNLLLAIAIYGVVPLLLFIAGQFLPRATSTGYYRGDEVLPEQVLWYLPYSYYGFGLEGLHRSRNMYGSGSYIGYDDRFELPHDPFSNNYSNLRVSEGTYFTVVFVVGCGYLLASMGTLVWTARRFDKIVGRAPQLEAIPGANVATLPQPT